METLETLEITEDSPNENIFKKQPPVCSIKNCSEIFRKIHRKTPVPKPIF